MKRERLLMRAARGAATVAAGLALVLTAPVFADDGVWEWPYEGSGSNGASALFSLTNNGAVLGGVAKFEITAGGNSGDVLFAKTVGRGRAGVFEIAPGAGVVNSSNALHASTRGGGKAGNFEIVNPANTADAIWGQSNGNISGNAVHGYQNGTGRAGMFEIDNAANSSTALRVSTNGTGRAGYFNINNPLNGSIGLRVDASGSINGRAGVFQTTNIHNPSAAVEGQTNGSAPGGVGVRGIHNATVHCGELGGTSWGVGGMALFDGTWGTLSFFDDGVHGQHPTVTPGSVCWGSFGASTFVSSPCGVVGVGSEDDGEWAGIFTSGDVFISQELDVQQNVGIDGNLDVAGSAQIAGDVDVSGNLSKDSGSFKIDDPLDPANKYLYHSFVESPDMMNIYNGNVATDGRGYATITLPEWFEALNRDFRYQVTVVDDADAEAFVDAKVIGRVKGNQFTIRTSAPGVEVSWQVTGIRHDAYAEAHRIPVEVDKPEGERGRYRHPELYGQPEELRLRRDRRPPPAVPAPFAG